MAKPGDVNAYIEGVDPALRPLFREVRAFVRRNAPSLHERLWMGLPSYGDAVLYIADHTRHINLGFNQGAHLTDPDGLLEGTGKDLRHAKIRAKTDLTPALARLVKRAALYGTG